MSSRLPGLGRSYDETKRVSRILELTHIITLRPRRYLRRDLANRFGVGERMIQKDLDVIRNGLKLPLSHSAMGYYFEETPRLPALQFPFSEALALVLALQAARQVSGIGPEDLTAAANRLESLFPPEFRPLLNQTCHRSSTDSRREHRQRMLFQVNVAMIRRYKLQIRYRTASRGAAPSTRIVRPYQLVPYVRSWHLIAFCELREAVLMFKVDRIEEAEPTQEHYRIPEDFDLDTYLGSTWGAIRTTGDTPAEVVLHFTPEAGRWVSEEYWHKSQRIETQADGSVMLRLQVVITPEFINWILYYGARVQVLKPDSLRQTIREEHQRAAEMNGTL